MPGFDSIIFITHDLDLALTYANRIIMLYDGKIAADGLPQDVLKDSEQLLRWRLLPTSLLELNYRLLPRTGKFQRAEALARYIV
jgi:energy-coupling factor transport system ATP-binding protein